MHVHVTVYCALNSSRLSRQPEPRDQLNWSTALQKIVRFPVGHRLKSRIGDWMKLTRRSAGQRRRKFCTGTELARGRAAAGCRARRKMPCSAAHGSSGRLGRDKNAIRAELKIEPKSPYCRPSIRSHQALKRWRCARCKKRRGLQIHHRRYRSHDGTHEIQNLEPVCWHCHRLIHECERSE
jgi:hypothetical protein